MSKEQATEKLKGMGFDARLENGVVMVIIQTEAERDRAKRAIKELGLRGSWGIRGSRNDNF